MPVYGGFSFELYDGSDQESRTIILESIAGVHDIDSFISGLESEIQSSQAFAIYTDIAMVDYSDITSIDSTSNTDFYTVLDCNISGFMIHCLERAS